jgi:hypothetical protein
MLIYIDADIKDSPISIDPQPYEVQIQILGVAFKMKTKSNHMEQNKSR